MNRFARVVVALGLLVVAAAGSIANSGYASAAPGVVGHVYINDNSTGTNTIGAFNRFADGTLVPMKGSPFVAGGAGTGKPIGSQGSLQVSSDGKYLLAVDLASNQISVLSIGPDGEPRPVGSSPVSSGGIEPDSIAVHGSLVYVANHGNGTSGSNYTGFTLNSGGKLTRLSNSTVPLPSTANPADVFFSPDGTHLMGTEVGTTVSSTWLIDSFMVGSDGRLTAAPGSPFPAEAPGPFGSEFRPTNSAQVFVSNAHGGPDAGSVSAFNVASNGALTSVAGSPFADNQSAPCWVEITHDGKYLFTVNTESSSISRFSIAADGSLTLLGSTPIKNPTDTTAFNFDARLDPSGSFLYVVDVGLDAVSVFSVSGGNLTELSSSPAAAPAGAAPFGIVVQ